jgi:hypothetical protein
MFSRERYNSNVGTEPMKMTWGHGIALALFAAISLTLATRGVQAAAITSVERIGGVTDGQPDIVAGPGPEGLQECSQAYMDRWGALPRPTCFYHWEDVPDELLGADYAKTFNDDKMPWDSYNVKWWPHNPYEVLYSVTLNQPAMLCIFVDRRYIDEQGIASFVWLTDGSTGAVFKDTGLNVLLHEEGGLGVLRPFDIYGAQVTAGTYVLGATCDGDFSRNFYAIAAVATPVITSVERIGGVTDGQPEIVAGPGPEGLQEGSQAYMDRWGAPPRPACHYHWEDIPEKLLGADYVKTFNDDKMPWDSYNVKWWPHSPYEVMYSVTLNKAAMLYIFVDRRYIDEQGIPSFAWLTDGSSGAVFTDTGLNILLHEEGGLGVLRPFDVHSAQVPAGTYVLVATCDGDFSRNFYAIAAVASPVITSVER